jgi:hypothetical protein
MLYKITTFNKYGNLKSRIFFSQQEPKFKSSNHIIERFKYNFEDSVNPPCLTNIDNNVFLVPGWQKVLPETTLEDINWIKKEIPKTEFEKTSWDFKSSSSDTIYVVRKTGFRFTCTCPGVWRSKTRECKHIKEVKKY